MAEGLIPASGLQVALWEPEIPPNTGNIARLCAATRTPLHLIGRLGFRLDDRSLKRAGVDYWDEVDVRRHIHWDEFTASCDPSRMWLVENPAPRIYTEVTFSPGDLLLFGSESHGVPEHLRTQFRDRQIAIPMPNPAIRSLNLSNAVAIVLYHALHQLQIR